MTGWKTKASGAASILSGVGLMIAGVIATPIDVTSIMEGWALVIAGGAILGIGHKIEKAASD